MPFEIIFFGLLFIFNIFYGTNKMKVAFLIGLMLSFLAEINVLDLQINNVYFNLFSMILVCLIALVKFNYKNPKDLKRRCISLVKNMYWLRLGARKC